MRFCGPHCCWLQDGMFLSTIELLLHFSIHMHDNSVPIDIPLHEIALLRATQWRLRYEATIAVIIRQ